MNKNIWLIDQAHSEINFKVRHLMISNLKGSFKMFKASIRTTEKDFETVEINLLIDAASIDTGDNTRDNHLKSSDFFDVQNHPQIIFNASGLAKADLKRNQDLWASLTIKGNTKLVKFNVQFGGIINDPWGNVRAGLTATGNIKRAEWGLTWNNALEAGGLMIGEDVIITCEMELINTSSELKAKMEAR